MFIAALIVSATDGKQPRCASSGKQLNCENPYQRILPRHKKEPTIDTHNLDESPRIMQSEKKPTPKVYILYESIYITVLWNGKIIEIENILVVVRKKGRWLCLSTGSMMDPHDEPTLCLACLCGHMNLHM